MSGDDKFIMFANRLSKVYRHLSKLARSEGVTCYRLFDRDLPEFPLIIEWYEGRLNVAEYRSHHKLTETEHAAWLERSLDTAASVLGISRTDIFLRERKRKAGRQDQYGKYASQKGFYAVHEGGLQFYVNLSDYLDTGLFLDHRITRRMFRELASGRRVLNLFCYTGSFSVYAAAGGAREIVSVDLSNTYLEWARKNMHLNFPVMPAHCSFVRADVLQYLPGITNGYFDLVILDPPTFSNSKMMKDILDIQRDHVQMINLVLLKMSDGGKLFFSTNARKFRLDADNIRASSILDITAKTTPFDFKNKLQRWCFLLTK